MQYVTELHQQTLFMVVLTVSKIIPAPMPRFVWFGHKPHWVPNTG